MKSLPGRLAGVALALGCMPAPHATCCVRDQLMPQIESSTTVVLDLGQTTVVGPQAAVAGASPEADRRIVAALDTEFQAAVKRNDAETMARILHEDFVLVAGNGKTFTREDLLQEARSRELTYERQDEDPGTQTVRVWGNTAVVTARLWITGVRGGVPFDRRLWFSDTYVRTPRGWRYAFGQASLRLPPEAADAKPSRMDPIRGRTLRWSWTEGPTAGSTHEHVFNEDGTVVWRVIEGPQKGKSAQEKEYAAVKVADDVYAVSYLAASGYTLKVVLNFKDKRMVGFASGEKAWYPAKGTFEVLE